MKKIAIVCFNLGWQTGGPRLIFSLAQEWKKMGHTVVLYTPEFNGEYFKDSWQGLDIRVVSPPRPFLWEYASSSLWFRIKQKFDQARLYREVSKKIAESMDDDFDMINVHDFAYRVAPYYRKKSSKGLMVWTMNDVPFMHLPKKNPLYDILSRAYNRYLDLITRRVAKHIDKGVVLFQKNKAWMDARGIDGHVLWCGVDFNHFFAPAKSFEAPQKSFLLLGVGAFNRYRCYDDIVLAASLLRKEGYDARVLLICKDLWNAQEDKAELLRITKDAQMEPYVDFRFEGIKDDEFRAVYEKSHIFVLTTHLPPPHDGFSWGLAVLEAMAAGLPAIITNRNNIKEALRDNETALFVDPRSPEQVAQKVKLLMDSPETFYRIAKSGQEFVKNNMTWEEYAKGYLKLLES
jgi:glycosyltransferase involved in cell wall biosynthesis